MAKPIPYDDVDDLVRARIVKILQENREAARQLRQEAEVLEAENARIEREVRAGHFYALNRVIPASYIEELSNGHLVDVAWYLGDDGV